MKNKKVIIAMMYDFDKTLCTTDMQNFKLIKNLGVSNEEFWSKSNAIARNTKAPMDGILAYMYQILKESHSHDQPIRRENFVELGKSIEFFEGVEGWFSRINEYAAKHNAIVEHYIISSGLKEMIEGSNIYSYFKRVYASEFHYDVNGVADWPSLAVNFTGKTQFLYRINKQVLDIFDDEGINSFQKENERPIPFRNMIYIGDGITDVPCMKLTKSNGGYSIGLYPKDNEKSKALCQKLINDERVNYIFPADYRPNKSLEKGVLKIIDAIIAKDIIS